MNTLEQWQTITDLKTSLQESANLDDKQSRAVTLLIELAYNTGKQEMLDKIGIPTK
jgi:hypothetical protein